MNQLSKKANRQQWLFLVWFLLFNLFALLHALSDHQQNVRLDRLYMVEEDLREARERLSTAEMVLWSMHRPLTPDEADISYAAYMEKRGLKEDSD